MLWYWLETGKSKIGSEIIGWWRHHPTAWGRNPKSRLLLRPLCDALPVKCKQPPGSMLRCCDGRLTPSTCPHCTGFWNAGNLLQRTDAM
jgi:hypothetical protein